MTPSRHPKGGRGTNQYGTKGVSKAASAIPAPALSTVAVLQMSPGDLMDAQIAALGDGTHSPAEWETVWDRLDIGADRSGVNIVSDDTTRARKMLDMPGCPSNILDQVASMPLRKMDIFDCRSATRQMIWPVVNHPNVSAGALQDALEYADPYYDDEDDPSDTSDYTGLGYCPTGPELAQKIQTHPLYAGH